MREIEEVPVHDTRLYAIESAVVAVTPAVLDTGSLENFQRFLVAGGAARTLIHYDDSGTAVGYLALCVLTDSEQMEVRSIAVLPVYQGLGYGKRMIAMAGKVAVQARRSEMTLVTSPDNTEAVRFYQKLGYEIAREVENYYGDGTARYVMTKQV